MKSSILQNDSETQAMRELINTLPQNAAIPNFEEAIQLSSVQATTKLWKDEETVIAFAFVDNFNNLRFEIHPAFRSEAIEDEIIAWGLACMKKRNAETGKFDTLDSAFSKENHWQIAMLERAGFIRENIRSLFYQRSLQEPIKDYALPSGFSLRTVKGKEEVENLVTLHRAAFGTEYFTVEARLAIMNATGYEQELDLVVSAPNGELAAFCICGLEKDDKHIGYTDPVGVHPAYQKHGLGKAIITAGFRLLKNKGVKTVETGTSSENLAMQALAKRLGFVIVSEKLWFSKKVA